MAQSTSTPTLVLTTSKQPANDYNIITTPHYYTKKWTYHPVNGGSILPVSVFYVGKSHPSLQQSKFNHNLRKPKQQFHQNNNKQQQQEQEQQITTHTTIQQMPQTTVLSYEGNDFVIENKPTTNLILYVGESPKPDDVLSYVQSLYGSNIKKIANESNRIYHEPVNQGEGVQHLNIRFVPRQAEVLHLMPELKPLEQSDRELEELLSKTRGKQTDEYKIELILRAERVLEACFNSGLKHKVHNLLNDLDSYRSLCRDFRPLARQRLKQQLALESSIEQIVTENNLNV